MVDGTRAFGELPILGLPGSELLASAERAGLPSVTEAFADRGYTPEGHLVPRSEPGALLHGVEAVLRRAVRLAEAGQIVAVDGSVLRVAARSLCLHGDTPGAVELARSVRAGLVDRGVRLAAFASGTMSG